MDLTELNPFIRYAEIIPSILEGKTFRMAQDWRLFYVLNGNGILHLQNGNHPLSPTVAACLPCGTHYYFTGKMRVITLNFDLTQQFSQYKTPFPPLQPTPEDFAHIHTTDMPDELRTPYILSIPEEETRLTELVVENRTDTPLAKARMSALLKETLCAVLRASQASPSETERAVRAARHFIQRYATTPIQNSDVAAALGYHPIYLNRIFKEKTGMTIHRAITEERIRTAKRLLSETGLTVDAIAEACGFSDRSVFHMAFRAATNITPITYRKLNRPR